MDFEKNKEIFNWLVSGFHNLFCRNRLNEIHFSSRNVIGRVILFGQFFTFDRHLEFLFVSKSSSKATFDKLGSAPTAIPVTLCDKELLSES